MAFNGPMYRQERLSKEEIKLLRVALSCYIGESTTNPTDQEIFLAQKLERMEKGRK